MFIMMTRSNYSFFSLLSISLLVGILVFPAVSQAEDIDLSGTLVQDDFNKAVRDLGTAFSYIPADPAESHGIVGFNVGVTASAVQLPDGQTYMDNAFANQDAPGTLFLPKVQLEKGLPFVEVGGFVAGDPDGNARLYGAEVKYPILEGSAVNPAISVRGHGTQLSGVDDLDLRTYGGDISISKGFDVPLILGVTPFAGYSRFKIKGQEQISSISLDEHTTTESRIFAGTRFTLTLFNIVAEVDVADEVEIYTARLNFGF